MTIIAFPFQLDRALGEVGEISAITEAEDKTTTTMAAMAANFESKDMATTLGIILVVTAVAILTTMTTSVKIAVPASVTAPCARSAKDSLRVAEETWAATTI